MPSKNKPDPIDVQVGITLRRIRKERGISQMEVADALGITFQQIQKYERGTNRISASMLVKAARVLGVRPSDMLPDETDMPAAKHNQRLVGVKGATDLVEAYEAISSPRHRRAALSLVRALARGGEAEVE